MTDPQEGPGDAGPGRGAGRPRLAEIRDLDRVYQPAEDSRLLAETAVGLVEPGDLVVDVGTGSGYVAARLREATGARVLGTDLNPLATRQAAAESVPVVQANLLDPIADGTVDWVVCNPPYLPTPAGDEWDDWMEYALSGGPDGRAVIDPLLADLRRPLAPGGEALVLVSSLTGIEAVRAQARASGLTTMVAAEEAPPAERLVVLRLRPVGEG